MDPSYQILFSECFRGDDLFQQHIVFSAGGISGEALSKKLFFEGASGVDPNYKMRFSEGFWGEAFSLKNVF